MEVLQRAKAIPAAKLHKTRPALSIAIWDEIVHFIPNTGSL
jgi:hypothetical protein